MFDWRVGTKNAVTSCDLHILVHETAQSVASQRPDCRPAPERLSRWRRATSAMSPEFQRAMVIGTLEPPVLRPRRARCVTCAATHVLLPAVVAPRRADTAVVGAALQASARGVGYRAIAARLRRPVSTVRRWIRAGRDPAHAAWLRGQALDWPPPSLTGTSWASCDPSPDRWVRR